MDDSRRPGNFSSTIFEWVIALLSLSFRRCCFFFWGGIRCCCCISHHYLWPNTELCAKNAIVCHSQRLQTRTKKLRNMCFLCDLWQLLSESQCQVQSQSQFLTLLTSAIFASTERKKNRVCILRLNPFLTRNQNLYPQGWFYCWLSVLGNTPCRDQFFRFSFSQCSRDRFNKRHNGKSSSWRTTQSKSKVLWWTAANATAVVQSAPSQCTTAMLVMVVVPHEWHTFNGCTSFTFILGVCPTFDFKCNLCTCHSASW